MKKLLVTLLLLVCSFAIIANPVTLETAQKIAVNYFKHFAQGKPDYTVSNVVTMQKDGLTTFYVFVFQSGGYVMVSADDAFIPVLGYSYESNWTDTNIAPAFRYWLDQYSSQIKFAVDEKMDNKETLKEWNHIMNNEFPQGKLAVNPLCSTNWGQGTGYNTNCPGGSVTGCVATATAQVMKKWAYPVNGLGTHSYDDATYGNQSVNYSIANYQWASMPNNSGSTATAKLMYHCGVGVNMAYSPSGSGAQTQDIPHVLVEHENYQNSAEFQYKAAFSATDWTNLLKIELDAGRPMVYSGDDGTTGHAWVCDGYDNSNNFHMNWGWDGSSNGYYAIGNLQGFNNNNGVVTRITPPLGGPIADFVASTTTPAVGGTVTFTDYSTNSPTAWTWSFPGGTPSSYTGQTPPSITYSTAGKYMVSLTVTGNGKTDTKIRPVYIRVGGTPSAWIKQNTGFTHPSRGINQIYIVDPNTVWAAAYNGVSSTNPIQEFTKTTDGGTTWTPGTISFTNSELYGVANIYAMSGTTAYAAMFPSLTNGGYIVKTTNGGTTWTTQTSANFSASWLDFVYFFDANNGVCVGDPTATPYEYLIYTTSNGGTTWTQVPVTSIPGPSNNETAIVNQFDAFGNSIWFGTTMGRVFRSTDKGLTWAQSSTGLGTSAFITPVFKDASTGIVIGTSQNGYLGMRKTTNGGQTWAAYTPTGYFVKVPSLDFIPGSTNCWVNVSSGNGLGSSYSKNDGTSFLNIDTGSVQYTCVTMYDMNTGWAGSFNTNQYDGGIYKWQNFITVGMDQPNENSNDIHIYPSPTIGPVNVEFSIFASDMAYVRVYNLVGELVYSEDFDPSFNNLLTLNLAGQDDGIYFVRVLSGNEQVTKKILLTK